MQRAIWVIIAAVAVLCCSRSAFGVSVLQRNDTPSDNQLAKWLLPEPSVEPIVDEVQPKLIDMRLPKDVIPEHYNLTLAPFIYGKDYNEFYFVGSVNISVRVLGPTSSFKLHSAWLNISLPRVIDDRDQSSLDVVSCLEDPFREWYSVSLAEPLQCGVNYTIVIDRFKGFLSNSEDGIYLNKYYENGMDRYLITSQLQATFARKIFPCFDEPAFKATFDVSLVRHRDFKAISNMPSRTVSDVSAAYWFNGTNSSGMPIVREDFDTTPIMSTYLLAFIVSQFDHVSAWDTKGREYRNWVRPQYINMTGHALKAIINVVEYFEAYFDVAYPLNKTDQALAIHRHGAMENWGLIIYSEADLVLNSQLDSASHLQYIDYLVSHELSHMWFGNLVTMTWWNELWLNEGFATFVSRLGTDFLHPHCDMDSQFVVSEQESAFQIDASAQSHPVYIEVYSSDQVSTIFNEITYSKAATVIRMMYSFLGDSIFRVGIGNYLKNNSYKNALNTALYQSLTLHANASGINIDVGKVMDRWIRQMGYPVVHCSRQEGALLLKQQHFLSDPKQSPNPKFPSPYYFTWIIPITMVTRENASNWNGSEVTHLVQWMQVRYQRFSINTTSWYMINLRSAGFYRVNYNAENWDALIAQLHSNHSVFTPQDRVRLLSDCFALARTGSLEFDVPLRLAEYLKYERHYAPWKVALQNLRSTSISLNSLRLESELFRAYLRAVIDPVYRSIGIEADPTSDTHLIRLTRELIVKAACTGGLRLCKVEARAQFDRFVASNFTASVISPDSRRAIFCEGLATASSDLLQRFRYFLRMEAENLLSRNFESDIQYGLGCAYEGRLRRRRRSYSASGSFGHHDVGSTARLVDELRKSLWRLRVAHD